MKIDLSEFYRDRRKKHQCVVGDILTRLLDKDREKLSAALVEPTLLHSDIVHWLEVKGIRSNHAAIGRHRAGVCCCD